MERFGPNLACNWPLRPATATIKPLGIDAIMYPTLFWTSLLLWNTGQVSVHETKVYGSVSHGHQEVQNYHSMWHTLSRLLQLKRSWNGCKLMG